MEKKKVRQRVPKEINEADILKAIRFIDANGIPKNRESNEWDLLHDGDRYPPKFLISKAAEYSILGRFLTNNFFTSYQAIRHLEKLKFQIIPKDKFSNIIVLDDLIGNSSNTSNKQDLLAALKKLQLLPPEKKLKVMQYSNRRDTPLIKLLKRLFDYKCQMPGCTAKIIMANGDNYCEVAHIDPFAKVNSSEIENLIVLCPNHHKEWDLGKRIIEYRTNKVVQGKLNNRSFMFNLLTIV